MQTELEVGMRARLAVWLAGIALVASSVPLLAHHSFAAEYDASKPVTLRHGHPRRVTNPHARFYVDGKTRRRCDELEPRAREPERAGASGLTRNFAKFGDVITVEGSMAGRRRDGQREDRGPGRRKESVWLGRHRRGAITIRRCSSPADPTGRFLGGVSGCVRL